MLLLQLKHLLHNFFLHAQIVGLGAAIDYLTHRGLSAIQLWEKQLLAYAEQRLTAIPEVEILGSPASRVRVVHALCGALWSSGFSCAG